MPNSSDWEMTPEMERQTSRSAVQEFYKNQTILLTGVTGFIGQCLLERLLRCSGVEKIYTIVRPKRAKSLEERMTKYFELPIFDRLREKDANFMKKVVPLNGDLGLPDIGLSPENRRLLTENVTLIIHNAASVLFFQRISQILKVNVLGTQTLLELARDCSHLRAFMYVSTAFSQSQNLYTEERCYSPPGDIKMALDIIAADTISEEGMTEVALAQCLDYCKNNYTFSKAITEGIIERYSRTVDFPCGIFRPTIVFCAEKEPIPGWTSNWSGPTQQFIAATIGVMHFAPTSGDTVLDLVPVDMTCNALITYTWHLATVKKPREKCYVYHYSSSTLNGSSLQAHTHLTLSYVHIKPTVKMVWYPSMLYLDNMAVFYVFHYLFHVLPAVLFDVYRLAIGKKPFVIHQLKKMTKNVDALLKFMTTNFRFETKEWFDMWERMNPTDREIFYSDIRDVHWPIYTIKVWDFQRVNLLNETDQDLHKARRKLVKLKILHFATCGVMFIVLFNFLYSLVCRVLGL